MGECLRTLQLGRAAPAWLVYVDYVTAIITQGLCNAALTSYSYMHLLVNSCRSLCVCPFIDWCPINEHHPISCWVVGIVPYIAGVENLCADGSHP